MQRLGTGFNKCAVDCGLAITMPRRIRASRIGRLAREEEGKVEGIKDERAVVVDTGQEVVDRDRVLRDSINPAPRRKTGEERKEERIRCCCGAYSQNTLCLSLCVGPLLRKLKENESDQRVFA